MIGSTRALVAYAYPKPADLRKGYNGLFGLVEDALLRDPMSGAYFLFVNKRRTSCKVLHWDGTGLCLYCKRLEQGRFAKLWRDEDADELELTATELSLFLEGSALIGRRRRVSPQAVSRKRLGDSRAM
ncbi:MAG: IS66 family insertion sequence element accessory protein TnpB [Myxococcota bacterium]